MRRSHPLATGAFRLALALVCLSPAAVPLPAAGEEPSPGQIWVDEVTPGWFADRWQESSPVHAAATGPGDDAERLEAVDRALRRRWPTRGLPEAFVSQGGALDRFRKGLIQIGDYPPIPWAVPVDWHRLRPEVDETYFAELHSWRFMTQLFQEYRKTGEPELLAAVEAVAEDWIRQNPFPRGAHRRAWHEGAVMKRTLVLVNWLDTLAVRAAVGRERFRPHHVAALLAQHVDVLLMQGTYTGVGNHGMRQDLALIVASFALPGARLGPPARRLGAMEWRALALDRLERIQIGLGFTNTGVWREHSPIYHRYVAGILELVRVALRANDAEVPERLDRLLDQHELYLAHVFTPAARYPPIGDSAEQRLPRHIVETPQLLYSVTGGRDGEPPPTVDGFFPEAGEAVLRDRWGATAEEYERSLYVHLHAAQHLPMGHRHQDDLSVVLYNGGRWWVVDAGRHGYGKNPWREHVVTAWAHNGVILEGAVLGPTDRQDLDAGIDPEGIATPAVAAVRAWTERFSRRGARAERVVVLLRERRTLLLVDRMEVPGGGTWTSQLHLAPDLSPEPAAEGTASPRYSVVPKDGNLALDLLYDAATDTTSVYRGQRGARRPSSGRGGWISPEPRRIVPTAVVSAVRSGARVVAPTLLAFRAREGTPAEGLEIEEMEDGTYEVSWRANGEAVRVVVAFTGAPLRKVNRAPVTGAMRPSARVVGPS